TLPQPPLTPTNTTLSLVMQLGLVSSFFFSSSPPPRLLHSFPTRRSSDLGGLCPVVEGAGGFVQKQNCGASHERAGDQEPLTLTADRKSTRLNSSHVAISYAVFCLKKKSSEKRIVRPLPLGSSPDSNIGTV